LDSARLDETGPGWVRAVMNLVRWYRDRSASVAEDYYWQFREVELPAVGIDPSTPPSTPRAQLQVVSGGSGGRERTRGRRSRDERRPGPEVIPEPRNSRVRFELDESSFREARRRRDRVIFEVPELNWEREDRAA